MERNKQYIQNMINHFYYQGQVTNFIKIIDIRTKVTVKRYVVRSPAASHFPAGQARGLIVPAYVLAPHNQLLHFRRINRILLFINDLPAGLNQHRIG